MDQLIFTPDIYIKIYLKKVLLKIFLRQDLRYMMLHSIAVHEEIIKFGCYSGLFIPALHTVSWAVLLVFFKHSVEF